MTGKRGLYSLARKRRIDPEDLRLTISAYIAAGYPKQAAVREALKSLGRNDQRKQTQLAAEPVDTTEDTTEDTDTAAEAARIIWRELRQSFPITAEALKVDPSNKKAIKTATLAATWIASELPEPYRTIAQRIAKTLDR